MNAVDEELDGEDTLVVILYLFLLLFGFVSHSRGLQCNPEAPNNKDHTEADPDEASLHLLQIEEGKGGSKCEVQAAHSDDEYDGNALEQLGEAASLLLLDDLSLFLLLHEFHSPRCLLPEVALQVHVVLTRSLDMAVLLNRL